MSFTAKEIELVSTRLDAGLSRTVLRKVISPAASNRICLELRGPGVNHYLQICVAPQYCSIGRVDSKPKAAQTPVAFVMLLRKLVENGIVEKIEQRNQDRVVAILLARKETTFTLLCELSGRHGNLFLLDKEDTIVGSYFSNRSNKRNLVAGARYQLPINPPPLDNQRVRMPVDADFDMALMRMYTEMEAEGLETRQRMAAHRAVNALLKKQRLLVKHLEADQQNAQRAVLLQNEAFVLQANLKKVKKGLASFDAVDFEGNGVKISLDPKKTAVENMQAMFNKASRLHRATDQIEHRMLKAMMEEERLVSLQDEVSQGDAQTIADIIATLEKTSPLVVSRARKLKSSPLRLPYRKFVISAAHTARVGKSAKDNDTLTLRHASPNDLWLHVRGLPGSHVVVPMGKGEEPSQDVLVDAAHLAVYYSSAKGDDCVEVTYTQRKYVQKPKGAAHGSVRLLREKTFILKFDNERMGEILRALK